MLTPWSDPVGFGVMLLIGLAVYLVGMALWRSRVQDPSRFAFLRRFWFFLKIVYRPDWFDGHRIRPGTAWEVAKTLKG